VKLTVRHVSIPMRYRFGHAKAARAIADNLVVEVVLEDGTRGHGEAVPREYVTGETITTAFAALTAVVDVPLGITDADDFATVARALAGQDLALALALAPRTRAPAAAAALELALLDAYARREGRSVLDAVTLVPELAELLVPSPPTHVRQTLTIGDDLDGALARAGALGGALDLKLKVGFGAAEDLARGRALRARFGNEVDLRADANAAWARSDAAEILTALSPIKLSSVEEPLRDRDLAGCALLRRCGTRVMLDESLCTLTDAERAIEADAADLFNLRLSKCGGLFGTLRLVQRAERAGIDWQLGCMVGESGILSCLGRLFVARVRGARYFESTVPTKSLEADLTTAQLDHVAGTRDTPVPTGPGFGAEIVPEVLERYTVAQLTIAR